MSRKFWDTLVRERITSQYYHYNNLNLMDPLKSLEDPRWSVDHLENRWSPLSGSIGLCLPYVSPSLHDQECLGDICTSSASIFEHLQWGAAPKEVTRCPRLLDCPDKPHRRGHQECYRRQAVMAYSSGGCMSGSWCPCGQDGFLFPGFGQPASAASSRGRESSLGSPL